MPTSGVARERFFRSSGDCPDQTDAIYSLDPRSKATLNPGFSNANITATYNDDCEAFVEATATISAGATRCEAKITRSVDWSLAAGKVVENTYGERLLGNGIFAMSVLCGDGSGCNGTFEVEVVQAN